MDAHVHHLLRRIVIPSQLRHPLALVWSQHDMVSSPDGRSPRTLLTRHQGSHKQGGRQVELLPGDPQDLQDPAISH